MKVGMNDNNSVVKQSLDSLCAHVSERNSVLNVSCKTCKSSNYVT